MSDYEIEDIYLFCNCSDPKNSVSIYADAPHEKIREEFIWGRNFDKNGKKLPHTEYIKLKDLDTSHVEALCYFTLKGYPSKINKVFVDEHNYRIDNKEPK